MKFCPQCGTTFEPEARFCLECGFDRTSVEQDSHADNLAPGVYVAETQTNLAAPAEFPDSQPEITPVCPKCGKILIPGDRFCLECGFDTMAYKTTNYAKPEPVPVPPIVETSPPPKPEILPPSPEPARAPTPVYTKPAKPVIPPAQPKGKNTVLWIVLILLGIGALGTAGWFAYNQYLSLPKDTTDDTPINMGIPENPAPGSEAADAGVTEQPEAATPIQPNSSTKPVSRIDQELAKQKTNGQAQTTRQNATEQSADISANTSGNDITAKVILEVGRKEEPKSKNPKNPTKLMIQKATMLTRITTDHYNDGMGTPRGGTITIKDRQGNRVGSYKAFGKTGKNGTPSAKWVAEPNIMLEKGTYFILDSDMATWSKNFVGTGFVVVEGYEVE